MPVCPNCKGEYRKGFTVCADCGETLVEELDENLIRDNEHEVRKSPPRMQTEEEIAAMKPTFLCSLADDVSAGVLIATLEENGIPVLLKKPGAGEYMAIYMGMNVFGIDVYVPARMLESAQVMLYDVVFHDSETADQFDDSADQFDDSADQFDEEYDEEYDEDFETEMDRSDRDRRVKGWLLIAILLGIPALVVILGKWLLF